MSKSISMNLNTNFGGTTANHSDYLLWQVRDNRFKSGLSMIITDCVTNNNNNNILLDTVKKEESDIDRLTICDWLQKNQYPMELLPIFVKNGIQNVSDFGKLTHENIYKLFHDQLILIKDRYSSLRNQLVRDIVNYKMCFDKDSNFGKEKERLNKLNELNCGKLKYLGLYKCVILDYLHHKRINKKPYIHTETIKCCDNNNNDHHKCNPLYSAFVSVQFPDLNNSSTTKYKISGFCFHPNTLLAEYGAFKSLFDRLFMNKVNYIDWKTFNGIIQKYQTYNYSNFNASNLLSYFNGIREIKHKTIKKNDELAESDKSQYFYRTNINDAKNRQNKRKIYLNHGISFSKQQLWFDAFYYLFSDQITGEVDKLINDKKKDLIFTWMKSYNSRKEFFGNMLRFGLWNTLNIMKN